MFSRKHNCCGKKLKIGDEIENSIIINNNLDDDSPNNTDNKNNTNSNTNSKNNTNSKSNTKNSQNISSLSCMNFKAFTGKTVTVYVNGGGISGSGFTGVLLAANEVVVRLLTQPASAPACALGGACDTYIKAPALCAVCPNAQQFNPGTVVEIPIWNIVAFVHNAI